MFRSLQLTGDFHIKNIGKIRNFLSYVACSTINHALISCQLDYSNSLLYNVPRSKTDRLQRLQNQCAHILTKSPRREHMFNLWEALLCFVDKYKFLGFSISRDILNRDIQSSINMLNRKCNEVRLDFSILNSDIKSKLISIFLWICMDAVC